MIRARVVDAGGCVESSPRHRARPPSRRLWRRRQFGLHRVRPSKSMIPIADPDATDNQYPPGSLPHVPRIKMHGAPTPFASAIHHMSHLTQFHVGRVAPSPTMSVQCNRRRLPYAARVTAGGSSRSRSQRLVAGSPAAPLGGGWEVCVTIGLTSTCAHQACIPCAGPSSCLVAGRQDLPWVQLWIAALIWVQTGP
jgi:hypothetical protein